MINQKNTVHIQAKNLKIIYDNFYTIKNSRYEHLYLNKNK